MLFNPCPVAPLGREALQRSRELSQRQETGTVSWQGSLRDMERKYPLSDRQEHCRETAPDDPDIAQGIFIQRDGKVQQIIPVTGSEKEIREFFAPGSKAEQILQNPLRADECLFAVNENFYAMPAHEIEGILEKLSSRHSGVECCLAVNDIRDKAEVLRENRENGKDREERVKDELKDQYPEEDGYTVLEEVYLRDESGDIVKDEQTGERRRIDFIVVDKDNKVVDSVEVTSNTADKTKQLEKEERIKELGGTYIKLADGTLIAIPPEVTTRVDRRD